MSFEVNSNHSGFQKAFVWAEHGMNMHNSANNIQLGEWKSLNKSGIALFFAKCLDFFIEMECLCAYNVE